MLPVLLVTGFLGAGKTTLLAHALQQAAAAGRRIAVVVNEFGGADVDGALLASSSVAALAAVAGGCACCAGQDDFEDAVLEFAARRAQGQLDALVVEASGLADPVLLLEHLSADPLAGAAGPVRVVTLVEPAGWNQVADQLAPLLRRQAALADLLLLTKSDITPPRLQDEVSARLQALNPRAAQIRMRHGELDWEVLWPEAAAPRAGAAPLSGAPAHARAHSCFVPVPHPAEEDRLRRALLALPPQVWRAKGFVRLRGQPGLWLVQVTAGDGPPRVSLAPFHLPWGRDEPQLGLVFIGAALETERLRREFGGHRLTAVY